MENQITPQAIQWLKRQSMDFRVPQMKVFLVRLIQFIAQIFTFWLFAEMMMSIVVEQQAFDGRKVLYLAVASCIWLVSVYVADSLSAICKNKIESQIESDIHAIWQQQQTALIRRYSSAYWQQLIFDHIADVGNYVSQYCVQKWMAGITPLVILLVIAPINYVVAVSLLLCMPVVPLFMIIVGKGAAALHRKHFIALERLGAMFSDRLKALPLITSANQHHEQQMRLSHASNIVNSKTMKVVSVAFLSTTVLDFFSTLSIALVAVFIGFSLIGEFEFGPSMNLHTGLFMLLVAPLLFAELKTLGRYYHQKSKAEASAERFAEIYQEVKPNVIQQNFSGIDWLNFQVKQPNICAKKISIQPSEWIFLEGQSGAGKTVLLEALMGFREASHQFPALSYLLTQDTVVLDNTLRYNLTLGRDFADHMLWEVLVDVELNDWAIKLEQQLDTPLGDYPPLSGGEAQRLALARILLINPEVVFLDEPTAHLTQEQHRILSLLLRQRLQHKTVIWASHKSIPDHWFTQHWQLENGVLRIPNEA
ncbi:ABC transporter ATP-binding protein/permease [Aliiglaciecola lipolytica]|uniref:ABC transporter ATP-binding protein/permease n=1 Tax=Aliiglaciecola lipolytica TaxID=477689 RepID=UPI001C0A395D|nr:ATP-binding cassette domain-containing protein [Aliiglaciecola lipolytica]MBU2878147.1 ATP-binding cassette domain-containing protein [Aliiglaciecola lipolytica]